MWILAARDGIKSGRTFQLFENCIGSESLNMLIVAANVPTLTNKVKPIVEQNPRALKSYKQVDWLWVSKHRPKNSGDSTDLIKFEDWQNLEKIINRPDFDEEAIRIFKPRTKTDLQIRRTRIYDWLSLLIKRPTTYKILREQVIKQGYDYIFTCNLMASGLIYGDTWLKNMITTGCFEADITHYISVCKWLNDTIKTRGLNDGDWNQYVECAALSGYRNPPFPGFDPIIETQDLAEGGETHYYGNNSWLSAVHKFLKCDVKPLKQYLPFEEYVKKVAWLTAGSSSVGKVEVELPSGEHIKFRARKNMVADVVNLDDLFQVAKEWNKQENYTIIKAELGKIRLAVSSDIYTYLQMSWITYLMNDCYNQWPGATTEEDFVTQTERMVRMLKLVGTHWGLPFDYAGFDHQPTTAEIKDIAQFLCELASINVPSMDLLQFKKIVNNVLEGFDNSTLEWKADKKVFRVTGSLMSGLRWTSIIGNAWNSVVTGLAQEHLQSIGVDTERVQRYIRGDDSAIFTNNWATGVLFKTAYDVVGAKAGAGKFSLQRRGMEFLRIWYSDHCIGYPSRSLPGLVQRKPWSNEPWTPDYVLRNIYEVIKTLRRRVKDHNTVDQVWQHLKRVWCKKHKLPIECIVSPRPLGGLGIESSPITYSIHPKVLVDQQSLLRGIKVTNQNLWRQERITTYFLKEYGIKLDTDRANRLSHNQFISTFAADDVRGISRQMREEWSMYLSGKKWKVTKINRITLKKELDCKLDSIPLEQISIAVNDIKAQTSDYGRYPQIRQLIDDYHSSGLQISLRSWFRLYAPKVDYALNKFHRTWHLAEKLDYLQGAFQISLNILNPALSFLLQRTIASMNPINHKSTRLKIYSDAFFFEQKLYWTQLSQRIYNW